MTIFGTKYVRSDEMMDIQKATKWEPNAKQAAVLEAAQIAGINRNITKVCEEAHVHRKTFYEWLKTDPNFKEAWREVWHFTLERHLPGTLMALVNAAQGGDVSAIKLHCELAGAYKQKLELTRGIDIEREAEYQKRLSILTDEQLKVYLELTDKINNDNQVN
ncbi:MAG: phBC6A51 family helix-turn-helix protein [Candidatus Paceibacterota bacterium]|jgi:hypothetical protein